MGWTPWFAPTSGDQDLLLRNQPQHLLEEYNTFIEQKHEKQPAHKEIFSDLQF
jgi:hypothetical protein